MYASESFFFSYYGLSDSLDVSLPPSFYQNEIDMYSKTRKYSGTDPHDWWHRLHHHHHHLHHHLHRHEHTIAEGPHAQIAATGELRDELLDALFDFDSKWPEHLFHTLPLRELEHTFGYKLYR